MPGGGSAVVYLLFIVDPLVCGGLCWGIVLLHVCSTLWQTPLCRELVALLLLSSECHVTIIILCLFLSVPLDGL